MEVTGKIDAVTKIKWNKLLQDYDDDIHLDNNLLQIPDTIDNIQE